MFDFSSNLVMLYEVYTFQKFYLPRKIKHVLEFYTLFLTMERLVLSCFRLRRDWFLAVLDYGEIGSQLF